VPRGSSKSSLPSSRFLTSQSYTRLMVRRFAVGLLVLVFAGTAVTLASGKPRATGETSSRTWIYDNTGERVHTPIAAAPDAGLCTRGEASSVAA